MAWALTRLGSPARLLLSRAHDEAYHRHNDCISSTHLLLALMADDADPMVRALHTRGVEPQAIIVGADQLLGPRRAPRFIHVAYSPNAKSILFHAARRAEAGDGADTAPPHLWWALSRAPHSTAGGLLFELGQLDYLEGRTW
ncbi:hypothetical protein B1R94_00305 [Mycolicibacterium litorale]|nr:hypothetical protein B1R94_00305 [Mycolicibacterium litorale]